MSRRNGVRGSGRRSSGGALTVYLLDSSLSTFARSTTTFAQRSASTLVAVGANTRAEEDLGDGWGLLTSIERQWANLIANPRSFTGAPIIGPSAPSTYTAGYATSPDGIATKSARFVTASTKYCKGRNADIAVTSGGPCIAWYWVRATSGTSALQVSQNATSGPDYAASIGETWQRRSVYVPASSGAARSLYICEGRVNGAVQCIDLASDICADFICYRDAGRYPLRVVDTTSTQSPDDWQWADGQWDTRIATGSWSIYVVPRYSSALLASGDVRWLMSFGGSSDGVRIRHDGTGVLVECIDGGAVVAASGYLTFLATDRLNITVATATSRVTVNGVSGADGSALTWPTSGALRLGGIQGAAAGSGEEIDARISLPWVAGT